MKVWVAILDPYIRNIGIRYRVFFISGKFVILVGMTNKDYIDSIEQINDIINKTRTETKALVESLEKLKRFYVWEQRVFNGEIKTSRKRINKWKKNKLIQKGICFECASQENIHYHHVVPHSLGGNETIPLCNECHGKVHDRKFIDISSLVKESLRKKKEQGLVLGRRKGTEKNDDDLLTNPKYSEAIKYLLTGEYSYRDIRRMTEVSVNTILKINKALVNQNKK
jgi:5-methylcytosine-specific restriction endonuclease McrA